MQACITRRSPYLKYPHLLCGTPQYLCGTPHEHTEYMRILCGTPHCNAELRIAMRNSARNSGHAEFLPHQLLEKFPHQCRKFAENSDLVFLLCGKMRKLSTSNKFCSGKYLRKISSAEILDLDNFTRGKYRRKLISPDHK